jgi:DHA2 family methylenomycin A resistance protein-like MFS transporter
MRNAQPKLRPLSGPDASVHSEARPAPSKFAAALTLAAMSLGYGVVQLDVTLRPSRFFSYGGKRARRNRCCRSHCSETGCLH